MLEELLKYDGLGGKEELQFVLFSALPLAEKQQMADLKAYCTSNQFSIGRCLGGTLKLLEFMGIIEISNGAVVVNRKTFDPSRIDGQESYLEKGEFIQGLFSALAREGAVRDFLSAESLRRHPAGGLYYVKDSLIPLRFFGVRNLLLSLGFFSRDHDLGPSDLLVRSDFTELFELLVVNAVGPTSGRVRRRISLSELKLRMEQQEMRGREAEMFVLGWERSRLRGHPSIESVRRVSEDDVGCGFDIESFNDRTSVFVNKYIEVKSFSGEASFYWSRNEVAAAAELRHKYHLYLVDRDKMGDSGYSPRIFQHPHQVIFLNELWTRAPGEWQFTAPRASQDRLLAGTAAIHPLPTSPKS